MKKKLLGLVGLVCLSVIAYSILNKQDLPTKESKNVADLNKRHREFIENSPFSRVSKLSKKERKSEGLPPNKYLEREWELTMNPALGKPTPENLEQIRKEMNESRLAALANGRVSGDASDNNWVERGPNNVGGRTRAVMFDPNDTSNETVFAGGVSGGLWKNANISNSNSSWTQVSISENLNISCIAVDPNDSMTFYIGTGESYVSGRVNGNGVWKSTDGGTTWAKVFGGVTGVTTFEAASSITINSPAGVSGSYACFPATAFGTTITSLMTTNLILANDGLAPNEDACTAVNTMTGKIALIRRGSCSFVTKVKNAQDEGAIGVIMMNNVPGVPVAMGGTDATITIPAVMISKSDGDLLEAAIGGGTVNGSLNPATGDFTGNLVPGIQHINDILVRNNGGVSEVYVAAGDSFYSSANATTYLGGPEYGLYKSTNAGANWSEITLPLTAGGKKNCPNDIELGADNKVWIGTTRSVLYGEGGGEVLSSTNPTATAFESKYTVVNGARTQIATSPTSAGTVYVLGQIRTLNAAEDGYIAPYLSMVKTSDSFATTAAMALPNDDDTSPRMTDDFTGGQAFYDLVIAVDPTNENNLFVGGINLFKSINAGDSWSQFSHWYGGFGHQNIHADQHAIVFGNGDANKILFGNDGGVFYSSNKGTIATARNKDYNVTQFYSIGVAPTTAGIGDNFSAGAQDNGTQQFQNASVGVSASYKSQSGDGAATDYDQDGTDAYYISNYVYNQTIVQRSFNGAAIKTLNNESSSNGDFINQQALDSNQDYLYTNYSTTGSPKIMRYRISSGPNQKVVLANALLTGSPTALKVSPYTPTVTNLYIGTVHGDLIKVTSANKAFQSWSEIGDPNFIGSISDVEFGANENEIFVTMHNYGVNNIWYTNNGGATWVEKEGDLPDMPVKTILQNPLNSDEVVVGTELGVWYTNNFSSASPSWRSAFNGMSNVKVTDLDVRNDNAIYASTYGRGIFSGVFTATPLAINDEELAANTVTLYPTSSDGNVFVISTTNYNDTKVVVYDINGKLTQETTIELYANGEAKVNLTGLSSGMYFVNLSADKLNKTIKIIKK